jgi:diaminopimelate epimerase
MKLVRAHGLGNVYLVLSCGTPLTASLVQALCDTATGVGSDGVLEPVETTHADYGVRIWNPDGSVAEKSGNGLRIFARWLNDGGAPTQFSVWTGFDRVWCEVSDKDIRVQMGTATVEPARVPVLSESAVVSQVLPTPAPDVPVVAVGIGNPHCVLFVDDVDAVPWREWGAVLETHPAFPNRTNVQVASVRDDHIAIRIWERGAGVTPASGSSACAVAVAAMLTKRVPFGDVCIRATGGDLHVTVGEDLSVLLRGPVEVVGEVSVDERWISARGLA